MAPAVGTCLRHLQTRNQARSKREGQGQSCEEWYQCKRWGSFVSCGSFFRDWASWATAGYDSWGLCSWGIMHGGDVMRDQLQGNIWPLDDGCPGGSKRAVFFDMAKSLLLRVTGRYMLTCGGGFLYVAPTSPMQAWGRSSINVLYSAVLLISAICVSVLLFDNLALGPLKTQNLLQ